MVQVQVLGPIKAFEDGRAIEVGGPTQRRLLAALAAHAPESTTTLNLIEYLWGDDPPPSAPASLQSYVSRLRRALGSDAIVTVPGGYKLDERVELDANEFLAGSASLPEDPTQRSSAIERLLQMWRGAAMEGFDQLDFATGKLDETRLGLEEELGRLHSRAGKHSDAVSVFRRLTRAHPLRESAWTGFALALNDAGRQAEAIRALDEYRELLADLGLDPGPSFDEASDDVFSPPAATPRRQLQNWTTSFVGRSDDLTKLREALGSSRLVTVVAPGGMGKTRLATELARDFEGSVVEIRLESVSETDDVAAAALSQLGAEARGIPLHALANRVKGTDLVLFDNAEHVLDSTAETIAGLWSLSDNRFLVTSREPLNMPGELVFPLDVLSDDAAVALYRDRAMLVDPDFDEPDESIAALTRAVDQMPLAIEIAAARSRSMAPSEILERLGSHYEVLDRPLRGQVKRHRSLDALVGWSYELLDARERRVFERLSVIAGPFGHNLAQNVAGFGEVDEDGVPDLIASLVEKSLLKRTEPGRFQMLRTLRAHARSQLSDSDAHLAQRKHASWFAGLAQRIGEGLGTPDEAEWITYANYAVDDMAAAVVFATEHGDLDIVQRIMEGLFDWYFHRQPPSIESWGAVVLERAEGHEVWAIAHAWEALAQLKAGLPDEAAATAREGTRDEGASSRFAWFMSAEIACYQDRLGDALDSYRRQLTRASKVNDRIGVIDAVAGETLALAFQGHFERAVGVAADLERLTDQVGAPTYKAYADYARGEALVDSDPERAAQHLSMAAERAAEVKNTYIEGMARTTLGSVFTDLDRQSDAVTNLARALELWRATGLERYQWTVVQHLASLLEGFGDTASAIRLVAAADTAGRRPFGAGRRRWPELLRRLESSPDHSEQYAAGAQMSLDEATELGFERATSLVS